MAMNLDDDADVFLNEDDLAVPVVWKGIRTSGIFEAPDKGIDIGHTVMGNEYAVIYQTSALDGLKNGDQINVDGQDYLVRDSASLDDGIFSKATLKKV